MPYWLPLGLVKISVVPPIFPQLTEAGFAMPLELVCGVEAAAGAVVCAAVCTAVGVAVGVDAVWDGWVHPAMTRPAITQSPRTRTTDNFDSIILTG